MKAQTKIIGGMPNATEKIDWTKPMWLISQDKQVVLCTGDVDTVTFRGLFITSVYHETYVENESLVKSYFTPITTPITIEISNTND